MSLFLGKIHHWLFAKIRMTEDMERQILLFARKAGLPVKQFEADAAKRFEAPLPQASLESLIDHQNIHGWLQHRIAQAESRQAFHLSQILKYNPSLKEDLIALFHQQALDAAAQTSPVPVTPESMLQAVHNFLLEGMPCDRAHQIVENDENQLSWRYEPCLHGKYWKSVDGDVNHYYDFRSTWIASYVSALQPSWHYNLTSDGVHQMKKEEFGQ